MDIDLVYLWVDGNDPQWLEKRRPYFKIVDEKSDVTCKGRYMNNDELKYSLRSAEKYAPWIRQIFIVTDNQKPNWLDTTNPKIKIIDIKDIMPQDCLPCFNSIVIECYFYKIPGLSEQFLYANDDMFFNADVQPDFFFAKDGFPIVRLKRRYWEKLKFRVRLFMGEKPGTHRTEVYNASVLVEKKFGKYYSGMPHHNIDAYKKNDFRNAIEDIFREQAIKSKTNRVRTKNDLGRSVISYYALAIGHGHLKYVEIEESAFLHVFKPDIMERLRFLKPKLFCLNDNEHVTDEDRERIRPFLETIFPEKSQFEL